MTRLEQLAIVVQLASLIEETTSEEHQALLAVAHHVDRQLNRQTSTNTQAAKYAERPSRLALAAGCPGCDACERIPERVA